MKHSLSKTELRRNFIFGVANGTLFRLFSALTDPSLVLTWFVRQLTSSPLAVGLLLPIAQGGWFLPQLLTSGFIQRYPRKMTIYRAAALVRMLIWALLTSLVFLLGARNKPLLLIAFIALFSIYSLAAGVAGLPFMDIVGKAISPERRGSFFAWRDFTGGLLALAGSGLVRYMLDERRGPGFPLDFGLLFGAAGIAMAMALICFFQLSEPVEEVEQEHRVSGVHWRDIKRLLQRNSDYVLFIVARVALLVSTVALPFYSVFAKDRLGVPASMAGTYLAAYTVAIVGSTLFWGQLSDRYGNRVLMLLVSLLSIPLPMVPVLFGDVISYSVFTLVFLMLGIIKAGIQIVSLSFVLEIAPPSERVLYVGLVNTVLGTVSLILMVGGVIAEQWGLNALFSLSACSALLAAFFVWKLREPRTTRPQ